MLEALFGSAGSEKVLTFLAARGEGYAREISRFTGMALYPVQQQLDRLEAGGILVSKTQGRTRVYTFNPRYPFIDELKLILEKALALYPRAERERLAPSTQTAAKSTSRMTQAELAAYLRDRLTRG